MNIKKIALSVPLLVGGVLTVGFGFDTFDETVPQTRASTPQRVNLIDENIFVMPGSGNCGGCHAQPNRSTETMTSPPVIYAQHIQRI